jgi:hypothetical protein
MSKMPSAMKKESSVRAMSALDKVLDTDLDSVHPHVSSEGPPSNGHESHLHVHSDVEKEAKKTPPLGVSVFVLACLCVCVGV